MTRKRTRPGAWTFPVTRMPDWPRSRHPVNGRACPILDVQTDDSRQAADIFATYGSPVLAVVGGILIEWPQRDTIWHEWSKGGWHAYLVGDDGYLYYYAHLSSWPFFNPLTRVERAAQIGQVGQSGNAKHNCPHCHFMVRRYTVVKGTIIKGMIIDPYPILMSML